MRIDQFGNSIMITRAEFEAVKHQDRPGSEEVLSAINILAAGYYDEHSQEIGEYMEVFVDEDGQDEPVARWYEDGKIKPA